MRYRPMVLSLLTTVLLTGSSIAGDQTQSAPKPWKAMKVLRFFAGAEVDFDSRIYRRGSLYLVHPSAGDRAYLLSLKDQNVHVLETRELLFEEGLPTLDTTDLDAFGVLGVFEKQNRGAWLVWMDGDAERSVRPKPPLIGATSLEQVLEEKPDYRVKADAYEPDAAMVETLAGVAGETSLVIGFGTWCPVCAEWMPRFIKTLELVGEERLKTTFVSVDREIEEPATELSRYGIDGVPLFIVMQDGKERGRIDIDDLEAKPELSIESRLVAILTGGGS